MWMALPFALFILILIIARSLLSSGIHSSDVTSGATHPTKLLPPVLVPIPKRTPSWKNLTQTTIQGKTTTTTTTTTGYLIRTNQMLHILSPSKRGRLERTLSQAKQHCVAATNGGPFNADGTSSGPLVIEGRVEKNGSSDLVGFGTSKDKNYYLLGNFQQFSSSLSMIWNFVSGFGWLVYEGTNVVASSSRAVVAPRTAIALDQDSNLMLFVVDGCEKCLFHPSGLTLDELADVLIHEFGAVYAVNMDGGASSTMVYDARVVNQPTCFDYVPISCQRPVDTVLCVQYRNSQ